MELLLLALLLRLLHLVVLVVCSVAWAWRGVAWMGLVLTVDRPSTVE
jgi:hypothetical protein